MQSTPLKETNSPLNREQAEQLNRLVQNLRGDQLTWISGYLAGLSAAGHPAANETPVPASAPAGAPAPTTTPEITILFGSETGNSEEVARQAHARAEARGFKARVEDMLDFKKAQLKKATHLMVVCATHGEGEPPVPAEELHELVSGRKAPKLQGAKFSVLALGDTSYEHFCQAGRDFDAYLEKMGGERIHPRVDCDVDYEEPAEQWIEAVLDAFGADLDVSAPAAHATVTPINASVSTASAAPSPVYSKKSPFPAELVDNVVLNGRGSAKEVRHIELSLEGSGLEHEPGDSLGVVPTNDLGVVAELIDVLKVSGEDPVTGLDGEVALKDALTHAYEITTLTRPFVEKYAHLADSRELHALLEPDRRKDLMDYMEGREVVDLVEQYPIDGITAEDFVRMLRRMPPRLYSIASSYKANPDEVALTVAAVRYYSFGRSRKGVASTYLADRVGDEDTVLVYIDRNKHFKLPEDPNTPIIMVGPGTGVAPFRAFLEEREDLGAEGRNWLFFGAQHFLTDFLYQRDWLRWRRDGLLDRIDVAFSRDRQEKTYVQHRMLENARDIYAWLEEGAQFYVCGDADRMAHDVHSALTDIVREQGGRSAEDAVAYVKQLQKDKRYQRDVY